MRPRRSLRSRGDGDRRDGAARGGAARRGAGGRAGWTRPTPRDIPSPMAQAFVVTLEKELPDPAPLAAYAKAATGKAIYRESERLNLAARTKKVPPLTDMLSESQAVVI